ncbi:hypothetical protein ACH4UM_12945 [Streptomyces sp. NPDC020801]|uniref:hypothetical protein n=1 Tax=unclassified Streptomyces TaxID=2593676 RepID=UPI0037B72D96
MTDAGWEAVRPLLPVPAWLRGRHGQPEAYCQLADFRRSWGGRIGPDARPFVLIYVCLLGEFTASDRLGRFIRPTLARRGFGADLVDDAVRRICKV